ncbi:hypothetical protein [Halobellus rubicundus]|uniref:Uncharacterized protein n=1 Tax=Halobellus rubicundus TaxID=2996466 RepID=A0ABD5MGL1_9EURY
MSQAQTRSIDVYTGDTVDVTPVDKLSGGGTRIELDVEGGPRWRLDVNSTGNDYDVVTSWNERGELADVEVPAWIDDVLAQLHRV